MNMLKLGIVVPCYNEQSVIEGTIERLNTFLSELIKNQKVSGDSFVLIVDDGSIDQTWTKILEIKNNTAYPIRAIKFSRNFGHQNALLAGMFKARHSADVVVTIDADLQQDERVIATFIEEYKKGNEIVYGVRSDRMTDGFFKKARNLFIFDFIIFRQKKRESC